MGAGFDGAGLGRRAAVAVHAGLPSRCGPTTRRPAQGWKTSAALLSLLAAGCSLPTHPPPARTLDVPTAWRNAGPTDERPPSAVSSVNTATTVNAQWWQGFGDPELDAVVARALAANGDLRSAQARIAEYQARLQVALAAQSPTLAVTATPGRARARTPFGTVAEAASLPIGLQASYEVDLWGRLQSLGEAAVADLQGQQAAADAAALSVAANAASGYLNLRGLDAQLGLARSTLASREESRAHARRLFETGYGSRLDWLQAESEYRAAAGTVPQLERSIAQQENALSLLLARPAGPLPRGPALEGLTAPGIDAPLPSQLLRRRPDIAQAERRIASADASLAAARDQLLPTLQLNATSGLQAYTLEQLLNAPANLWSVGASVLAPLLQGGRLRAQTEVAASLRDQAVFAYEQVARNAFVEVDNALSAIARLHEQVTQAQARRDAANDVLRIAHNRYANGYASYLEELDAQRTLFSAELGLLQLKAALLTAHVDLYRALGGGWQAP